MCTLPCNGLVEFRYKQLFRRNELEQTMMAQSGEVQA